MKLRWLGLSWWLRPHTSFLSNHICDLGTLSMLKIAKVVVLPIEYCLVIYFMQLRQRGRHALTFLRRVTDSCSHIGLVP